MVAGGGVPQAAGAPADGRGEFRSGEPGLRLDVHPQGDLVTARGVDVVHLGVVPLAVANGASMNSQRAIGTGVISGMVTATSLAIFFVPLFFVLVRRVFFKGKQKPGSHS